MNVRLACDEWKQVRATVHFITALAASCHNHAGVAAAQPYAITMERDSICPVKHGKGLFVLFPEWKLCQNAWKRSHHVATRLE